jgi:hypothetical protein
LLLRAVEDVKPDAAVRMYIDACALLEEDGRDQMAFDSYQSAASIYIKLNRYEDAATVFVRWGQAADKCKAVQSQCKAYLSAIIVYLFADNFNLADVSYNEYSQIDSFFKSDQNHCAVQLLSAYREGRPDEIKYVVSTSSVIPHLDHMVILLSALCHVASLDCITQLGGKHWWAKQEKCRVWYLKFFFCYTNS